jgi:MFS family permease
MQRIAMPWLVYELTGSAFMLGVVSFAGQIPTFLIAPFAGVLTDRWNRYNVLIVAQLLGMMQALAITLIYYFGTVEVWHIVLLSVVWGIFNAFDVPSRQSFVVDLVGDKEDIGNAIALNSLMFNGARLIGPSVAGVLLATTGEGLCFLINTISYLFVIISLFAMKVRKHEKTKSEKNIMSEMAEGIKYAFGFTPIKYVIILLAVVSIMSMPYVVLIPVFAREILGGGSEAYGFIVGAAGLGALAGGLMLASRDKILQINSLLPGAAAVFGAGVIGLSFTRSLPLSMILAVVSGFGIMLHTAASNTVLQTITDEDKRGRVMSLYTMAIMGTAPFGSLLSGALAKWIGTPFTIMSGGLVCLLAALLFYRKLPDLIMAARPVYEHHGEKSGKGNINAAVPVDAETADRV